MTNSSLSPSLFISYRRTRIDAVRQVVDALQAAGIDCFFDVEDIDELVDFPERIRQGIDASHAILVWWSDDYARSDHCLAEFRRAWQHARRHSSDVGRRVWVLNPETSGDHVIGGELNSKNFLSPPATEHLGVWVAKLKDRLDMLLPEGPLADERIAQSLPALYNLPVPNAKFTGRGVTLLSTHSKLFPAQIGAMTGGAAVWLHGMGGLGKSEAAAKYARDFAHAFPGGVFWLSFAGFESGATLNEDTTWNAARDACYRALDGVFAQEPGLQARLLRDAGDKPLRPEQAREAISHWLNKASADRSPQPYLWILDNVPQMSPRDARDRMLELWRAPSPAGCTLVTTRDATVADGFTAERLDELGEIDSLRLLSRFRPIIDEHRDVAVDLMNEVGRHTLALMLLGERVRRDGDYAKTLETLRKTGRLARLEQIAERLRPDLGSIARSVIATFQMGISSLTEDAKRLLAFTALGAANEPIPRALLRGEFGGDEAGDAFADAITALLGASLLSERRGREVVEIHPLVADVASEVDILPVDRGAILERFVEALLAMMAERPRVSSEWEIYARLLPHANEALGHASRTNTEDNKMAELSARMGFYLYLRGEYVKSLELLEHAWSIQNSICDGWTAEKASIANDRGIVLRALGKFPEALEFAESAVYVRRNLFSLEDPRTAQSIHNLGRLWEQWEEPQWARRYYKLALRIRKRLFGSKHGDVSQSAHGVAGTFWSEDQFATAKVFFQEALDAQDDPEDPGTGRTLANLGLVSKRLGQFEEAKKYYEEASAVMKQNLGPHHPDFGITLYNLASLLCDIKEYPEAEKAAKQALSILSNAEGAQHKQALVETQYLLKEIRTVRSTFPQ